MATPRSNQILAFLALAFAIFRVLQFISSSSFSYLFAAMYGFLIAYCALNRCPARTIKTTLGVNILVAMHTIAPLCYMASNAVKSPIIGGILAIVGNFASAWALVDLGSSFGLRPALRSVVSKGAFARVRHPIYAGYVVSSVGYLLLFGFSIFNILLFGVYIGLTIRRINVEEHVLAEDQEYAQYLQSTKYRLIPWLF